MRRQFHHPLRFARSISLLSLIVVGSAYTNGEEPKTGQPEGYFLSTGELLPEKLVPKTPRTEEEVRQLEAFKRYSIAYWFETQRRWDDAREAYKKVLDYDADSVEVYRRLINLSFLTRRPQEGVSYLEKAVKLDPEDAELLYALGRYMQERRDSKQAIALYTQALASPRLPGTSPIRIQIHYSLGEVQEGAEDYKAASTSFQEVMKAIESPGEFGFNDIARRPEFLRRPGESYRKFGVIFRRAKDYDAALEAFRRAQKLSPRSRLIIRNIAEVYYDQERLSDCLEYLEKYLKQAPMEVEGYRLLVDVLTKLDREEESLDRIKEAAKNDPFNRKLQYYLGTLYEESGEIDKAVEIYEAVLRAKGANEVYGSLARIYASRKSYDKLVTLLGDAMENQRRGPEVAQALATWMEKLSKDKDNAKEFVQAAQTHVEDKSNATLGVCYVTASIARTSGQIDQSAQFYRLAIELRPNSPVLYRELARTYADNDRTQDAIEVLKESVSKGPGRDDPDTLADLARNLEETGNGEEAVGHAERAIELNGESYYARSTLAWVYLRAGEYKKSAEQYEHIIENFDQIPDIVRVARYFLSHAYVQLGNMPKAEQALLDILKDDPRDSSANNDLGYLWADQGKNLERAYGMIKIALETEPDNAAYLDSMGWVLYKLGRAEEALKYLERAVQLQADDGVIVDHLADAFEKANKPEKARTLWKQALELLEAVEGPSRELDRIEKVKEKLKKSEANDSD